MKGVDDVEKCKESRFACTIDKGIRFALHIHTPGILNSR